MIATFHYKPGPEFIKKHSAEHEISNAHKYKNIKIFNIFQAQISLKFIFSCSAELNMKLLYNLGASLHCFQNVDVRIYNWDPLFKALLA